MNKQSFSSNKKVRKLAITIFFVLLISLMLAYAFQFKINNFQNIFKKSGPPDTSRINLPIPLDNPNIRQVSLLYSFYGRIKLVKSAGDDMQLILDVADTNLPPFILNSKDSQIIKVDSSGSLKRVSSDNLKPGLTTNIQMLYDLRLHTWKITRVYIF